MPGRSPEYYFSGSNTPEDSPEVRADFHVANPDLRSLEEVQASNLASSYAESASQPEKPPTPHNVARIFTLHVIHMRRNKQSEQSQEQPRQNDPELV